MIQLLLIPVLFYLGGKVSLLFALQPDVRVLLWIPNSLLLATLLRCGFKRYVPFVLLILVAEVAADFATFALWQAIAFGMINLLEATGAYLLLRRWRFNPEFAAPADLAKFVVAGPVIAAFASALAAGGVYVISHGMGSDYRDYMLTWWFSDGLGVLIFTPLALTLWPGETRQRPERASVDWRDAAVLLGGLALAAALAMSHQASLYGFSIRPLLLAPFALYVAARFSLRTTSIVVVCIAMLLLYLTSSNHQPFGDVGLQETALWTQEYILSVSLMALGLSTLLSQHRASTRELERRVQERTVELSEANTKLEKLALTDALTGLPNRRALLTALHAEIGRQQRARNGLAVILFDIDRFKQVNDRYGHPVGDTVLRHVASIASGVIRSMDTLGRYGGEEFMLIAPEVEESDAVHLAERLRAELRASNLHVDGETLRVTASFGVAMLRPGEESEDALLQRADAALYRAKESGRDQVASAAVERALPGV